MSEILLIGLGPANDPRELAPRLQQELEQCARVFYPGDWVNAALRRTFGSRLQWGRELSTADVLEAARDARRDLERLAVLYNGDGVLFSGRTDAWGSQMHLAELLRREDFEVEVHAGLSAAQVALSAAGWSIPTTPQARFMIAAPCCQGEDPDALEQTLRCPCVLALFWCEYYGALLYRTIERVRGSEVTIAMVRRIGSPEQSVTQGLLHELRVELEALTAPATILIAQRCEEPWRDEAGQLRREIGPGLVTTPESER